jgi:O-antigen/teichoic acid export membrane protein
VSVVNLACGIAVAGAVSQSTFGAFAIALTIYWFALGLSRAFANEPYAIRFASSPRPDRRVTAGAAGTALALGAGIAGSTLLISTTFSSPLRTGLSSIALVLPLLLVQDFARSAAFASRRPVAAVVADCVWLVVFVGAWVVLASTGSEALRAYVLAWGLAAGGAAIVAFSLLGVTAWPIAVRSWIRHNSDLIPRLALESTAAVLMFQLYIVVVGLIAGLGAVGAIRAAQVLFGPWQVLMMGTMLVGLPEGARLLASRGSQALMRFAALVGLGLGAVALFTGVILAAVPDTVGVRLLGDSWEAASSLVLLTALSLAPLAAISGATLGLRALAAVERSLPSQIVTTGLVVAGAAVGAFAGEARGALIGVALAGAASACIWWWQLLIASRAGSAPGASTLGTPPGVLADEGL